MGSRRVGNPFPRRCEGSKPSYFLKIRLRRRFIRHSVQQRWKGSIELKEGKKRCYLKGKRGEFPEQVVGWQGVKRIQTWGDVKRRHTKK